MVTGDFKPGYCAALRDKNTLWLIDPEEVKPGSATPNPPQLPARTVLAASPNNLHYKGWHKSPKGCCGRRILRLGLRCEGLLELLDLAGFANEHREKRYLENGPS